jgi:hypothetical protein
MRGICHVAGLEDDLDLVITESHKLPSYSL